MVIDELLSPERWRPVHCSRWDGAGRPRVDPTCSSATCSPPAPTESSPALLQQGKPSVGTFLVFLVIVSWVIIMFTFYFHFMILVQSFLHSVAVQSEQLYQWCNQRIYITRRTDSNPHRLTKSQLTQPLPPALLDGKVVQYTADRAGRGWVS